MVIKETKNNETETYVSTVSHSAGWVGGWGEVGTRKETNSYVSSVTLCTMADFQPPL